VSVDADWHLRTHSKQSLLEERVESALYFLLRKNIHNFQQMLRLMWILGKFSASVGCQHFIIEVDGDTD